MPGSARPNRPAEGHLSLVTLGEVGVFLRTGDADSLLLDAGKPLALVIYLACSRGGEASRDHLTELLWANLERERAQSALRQAIWQIKNRLGDDAIAATRDRVMLAAPLDSDRDAFVAAVFAGDVDRALELYRGDFVTGFAAPGGAGFDDWVSAERLALRRMFLRAAQDAVGSRLARGRPREALVLARRARDADPLNQRAWRQVLECLIAGGDAIGAHTEADALTHLLEREDIEPDPATRTMLRDVHGRAFGRRDHDEPSRDLVAELVGREHQFSAIIRAWAQIEDGAVRHLHVTAPPGLGKTRLLLDIRNHLRGRGGRVAYLHADFGARDIGYAFASEVAARLARLRGAGGVSTQSAAALVALNPALSSVYAVSGADLTTDDEALRRRALALRELIMSVADDGPLALLIDDLHWSDPPSRRTLAAALSGIERSRLLVVSAARPTIDGTWTTSQTSIIELAPLDEDDVGELVASLAQLPTEEWAARFVPALAEGREGSPLLVLETIQFLLERELLQRRDERWIAPDTIELFRALSQEGALKNRIASLSSLERELLVVLAVAGMPIERQLLVQFGGSSDASTAALAALERRGLVHRQQHLLAVAHDEHARTALDSAASADLERIAAALGRALLADAGGDPQRIQVAATFFARNVAANGSLLSHAFARFVRVLRLRGDVRSDRAIAREFLGPSSSGQLERELVRGLPWSVRARFVFRSRVAATIGIVAFVASAAMLSAAMLARPTRKPDAVLVVSRPSADRQYRDIYSIDLDVTRWANEPVLDVPGPHPRWRQRNLLGTGGHSTRPDGRGWTAGVVVPDSGRIDIFDLLLDGSTRRITYAARDDYGPSWAPDNSELVFNTARWSRGGEYDLAIYDTLTRQTRQLTRGDDTDTSPVWSPDGSRIAFLRQSPGNGKSALCMVDASGDNVRCSARDEAGSLGMIGWLDPHRLLIRRTQGDSVNVEEVNADTRTVAIRDAAHGLASLSPDGRFALCRCARPGYPEGALIVYRVDNPSEFVVLRLAADSSRLDFRWAPTTPRLPYVAALSVAEGNGLPVPGIRHQLRASAIDVNGRPTQIGVVRWSSEDTTVATIDSTGRLLARRAGRVIVDASAGGWRVVRVPITIRDADSRLVFDESWTGSFEPAWIPFGQPRPKVVRDSMLGPAFLNNGDGVFFSGAYTTRTFDTADGLWVETKLSARLTDDESQEQMISLVHIVDSLAWAAWDRVTGDGPAGGSSPNWAIRYPHGPNTVHRGEQILITGPFGEYLAPVPADAYTGRPIDVVMQIFPDGRCAVALDEKVIWTGPADFLEPSVRVMLAGNSVGTRVLVGRLRVGTGIHEGVDWERGHLPR
jgi:DNA-binding SARP family transcriptional activator